MKYVPSVWNIVWCRGEETTRHAHCTCLLFTCNIVVIIILFYLRWFTSSVEPELVPQPTRSFAPPIYYWINYLCANCISTFPSLVFLVGCSTLQIWTTSSGFAFTILVVSLSSHHSLLLFFLFLYLPSESNFWRKLRQNSLSLGRHLKKNRFCSKSIIFEARAPYKYLVS